MAETRTDDRGVHQMWPERPYVTTRELAAIAGVNERTILREISRGHLTAIRTASYVIELAEAKRWLENYNPERTH